MKQVSDEALCNLERKTAQLAAKRPRHARSQGRQELGRATVYQGDPDNLLSGRQAQVANETNRRTGLHQKEEQNNVAQPLAGVWKTGTRPCAAGTLCVNLNPASYETTAGTTRRKDL